MCDLTENFVFWPKRKKIFLLTNFSDFKTSSNSTTTSPDIWQGANFSFLLIWKWSFLYYYIHSFVGKKYAILLYVLLGKKLSEFSLLTRNFCSNNFPTYHDFFFAFIAIACKNFSLLYFFIHFYFLWNTEPEFVK